MISLNGYLYKQEKSKNGFTYCCCAYKKHHNCPGRLILREDGGYEEKSYHNHPVDIDLIGARRLINNMKSAAKARPDDPTKIIAEELANFFANHLPAYTNIIRTVQRASKPLKRSNLESTIRFPGKW